MGDLEPAARRLAGRCALPQGCAGSGADRRGQLDQRRLDPATYAHVWDGAYLLNSAAQVFLGKWKVEPITIKPDWQGPYHGGDFGYAVDPTAAVRCYLGGGGDYLFVTHEAGGHKIELDQYSHRISAGIPDFEKYTSRWDSASPGSISMIQRYGLPKAIGAEKWPGSVEDGIRFLRSFKWIIVDPRCKELINELRLYSYKVDKDTGDVLPVLMDSYNHYIDALRYAVAPLIRMLQPAKAAVGTYANR
jgi:phage terminase large subunit